MNITVTFKHINSTEAIKQYAESKVLKLEKYLNNIIEAHITLSMERIEHKESGVAQIKLSAKHLSINAEEASSDIYSAIDLLMEKVEAQIKKHKEKTREKNYEGSELASGLEDESGPNIEIKEEYEKHPLSIDEALQKLKKKNSDFIIFKDKVSSKISFIFKGEDGNFSMISPDL